MSGRTGISWTDRTWNPVVGCTKVSQGCKHCYAKTLHDQRHKALLEGKPQAPQYREPFEVVQLMPDRLAAPLRWREPSRIFVNSVSDLFHEDVPNEFILMVFGIMAYARRHQFQILTKRSARMRAWFEWIANHKHAWPPLIQAKALLLDHFCGVPSSEGRRRGSTAWDRTPQYGHEYYGWPLKNVWLGVSVENQAAARERIPSLFETPAAVRFLSCEPLLGAVDLEAAFAIAPPDLKHFCAPGQQLCADPLCRRVGPHFAYEFGCRWSRVDNAGAPRQIDWVIVGGESGNGARPMHPDWAHSLLDQCQAAGVPIHFKQWGDWVSSAARAFGTVTAKEIIAIDADGKRLEPMPSDENADAITVARVGTKRAGRDLAGQTWDQWPEVRS